MNVIYCRKGILKWKDASETFNVTYELVKRGYSKEEIKKLWGLNLLRVLDEVENISKELMANNLVDLYFNEKKNDLTGLGGNKDIQV